MKTVKIFTAAIIASLLASIAGCGESDPSSYVLTGDFSDLYATGEVVVVDGHLGDQPNKVITAQLVDGKFHTTGSVESPRVVSVYVEGGIGKNGERWAQIKGQQFILEPGKVHVTYTSRDHTSASGKYNDLVIGSWKGGAEYNRVVDEFQAALKASGDKTLPEAEQKAIHERVSAGQSATIAMENNGLKEVVVNSEDPLASLLAIKMLRYGGGPWVLERMYQLAEVYPENEWLTESIKSAEQRKLKTDRARAIGVGSSILDFEGKNLAGETVWLIDTRKKNEYVLVEFWASWCGPCRQEIPHMKKAYAKYNKKGFEIFAFSLDDDRSAWQQASEEEQLTWVNISDLVGSDSPVATLYGVTGVPANYLVAAATGEIVAKDLRGDALDEKLAELFKEKIEAPAMMMSM